MTMIHCHMISSPQKDYKYREHFSCWWLILRRRSLSDFQRRQGVGQRFLRDLLFVYVLLYTVVHKDETLYDNSGKYW